LEGAEIGDAHRRRRRTCKITRFDWCSRRTPIDDQHSEKKTNRYIRVACRLAVPGADRASEVKALIDGRYAGAFKGHYGRGAAALRHRMVRSFESEADGVSADDIVRRLIEHVPHELEEPAHSNSRNPGRKLRKNRAIQNQFLTALSASRRSTTYGNIGVTNQPQAFQGRSAHRLETDGQARRGDCSRARSSPASSKANAARRSAASPSRFADYRTTCTATTCASVDWNIYARLDKLFSDVP